MQDYIKKQNELRKTAQALYKVDKGKGNVIKKILKKSSSLSKKASKRLKKALETLDPNIYEKNDFIQMMTFNRLVLGHLLKVKATTDTNLTSLMMGLSYNFKLEVWEDIVLNKVIPVLIKSKLI